jgi:hypothetical protein
LLEQKLRRAETFGEYGMCALHSFVLLLPTHALSRISLCTHSAHAFSKKNRNGESFSIKKTNRVLSRAEILLEEGSAVHPQSALVFA